MQMHTQTHFPSGAFVLVSTPEPLFYASFIKQVFIGCLLYARHILDPGGRSANKTDENLYHCGEYSVVGEWRAAG